MIVSLVGILALSAVVYSALAAAVEPFGLLSTTAMLFVVVFAWLAGWAWLEVAWNWWGDRPLDR